MAFPFAEIGRSVGVAQVAVACVWYEPFFVLLKEFAVFVRCHHGRALLLEDDAQVADLSVVHAFVVYLRQCVQFLAQFLHLLSQSLVFDLRQCREVGILRMQGEDADAGVRIGVGPCVCGRRVIDRQNLEYALAHASHPVYHLLQVAEVAHSETRCRAEREHRHERSGTFQVVAAEISLCKVIDNDLAVGHVHQLNSAVVARFPAHLSAVAVADGCELELYRV